MFSESGLFLGNEFKEFSSSHGVSTRFLIIHVECSNHQLDGAHKFHIIDPRFLQDLKIRD
jgi:hypothetical protein